MADEKKYESDGAPTSAVADLKSQESTPDQIALVFLTPEENGLSSNDKRSFRSLKQKLPTAEIIFVDINDFDETGELKPTQILKYKALQRANSKTKRTIHAHGSGSESGSRWIYSNSDAYPSESKSWGFFARRRGAAFSTNKVANLIRLIKDPLVFMTREELSSMESFPNSYLKISVASCFGEKFTNHLYKELFKVDSKKLPRCLITTGKKTLLLGTTAVLSGKSYHDSRITNGTRVLAAILICSLGLKIAGDYTHNHNLSEGAWIAAAIFLSMFSLACLYHIGKATKESNSDDKVVFIPDFHKETDNDHIPCQILSKKEFKRRYKGENVTMEEINEKPIEIQYGVLL